MTEMTVFCTYSRVLLIRHRLDPAVRGSLTHSIPVSRRLGASRARRRLSALAVAGHPLALHWDSADPRPFSSFQQIVRRALERPVAVDQLAHGGADSARLDDGFVRRRAVRVIGLQEGSFGARTRSHRPLPTARNLPCGAGAPGTRWAVAALPRMWRPTTRSGCVAATPQSP